MQYRAEYALLRVRVRVRVGITVGDRVTVKVGVRVRISVRVTVKVRVRVRVEIPENTMTQCQSCTSTASIFHACARLFLHISISEHHTNGGGVVRANTHKLVRVCWIAHSTNNILSDFGRCLPNMAFQECFFQLPMHFSLG